MPKTTLCPEATVALPEGWQRDSREQTLTTIIEASVADLRVRLEPVQAASSSYGLRDLRAG